MVEWIKKNAAVVAAMLLPLAVLILFSLAQTMQTGRESPKYEVVVSDYNYYGAENAHVEFLVEKNALKAVWKPGKEGFAVPRLYRYNPVTGSQTQINISLPVDKSKPVEINIPELHGVKLNDAATAPDGFTFANDYRGYSGDWLFGFGGGGRYHCSLQKGKSHHHFQLPAGCYGNTKFIGWVVP